MMWDKRHVERLGLLIRRTRMTQQMLVERTGIPIATLQRILHGRSPPGDDRLARIADALGVSVDEILDDDTLAGSKIKPVPIFDIEVAAGAGRYSLDDVRPIDSWPFPEPWLAQFGAKAALKLVTVSGDSQEPDLSDGDMVMIDTSSNRLRDGLHVVRLADVLMIKRVQMQGGAIVLKSANPSYDDIVVNLSADQDQFEVIGQAVWAGKML